jgi:3-deoxy-manno-octulosonate cytidylyltransferase (CMP-KDO synthetase)
MKIVAFIPARYSSTRFPGKPLAHIAGRPMIQHTYNCTQACPEVSEVYVATDDQRIMDAVLGFGGKAVLTAEFHPSGTDRVADAAARLGLRPEDVVVNVQGDQPVFQSALISQMVGPVLADPALGMSTLKIRLGDDRETVDPNCVKVVTDGDDFALFFSRSVIPFYRDHNSPRVYYKHLGFYCYRMEFLTRFAGLPVGELEAAEKLEMLRAMECGFRIKVVETTFDSIEVDTPSDLRRVEETFFPSKDPGA